MYVTEYSRGTFQLRAHSPKQQVAIRDMPQRAQRPTAVMYEYSSTPNSVAKRGAMMRKICPKLAAPT